MNGVYPDISARYRKFATDEAHGKSPLYEDLAQRIASFSSGAAPATIPGLAGDGVRRDA